MEYLVKTVIRISIHVQYIFFRYRQHRDIDTISILTCQHCRYFFNVNIVDIATSTMSVQYRIYTVYIGDISLTFTSSKLSTSQFFDISSTLTSSTALIAMYFTLNRYWVNIVYIANISFTLFLAKQSQRYT